jgi:hypothetical protein
MKNICSGFSAAVSEKARKTAPKTTDSVRIYSVYPRRNHNATIHPTIPKAIIIQQNVFQNRARISGAKI